MTTETNDSLTKAIALLGAVEVAPGRYAWQPPIGGWTWNICTTEDLLSGWPSRSGEIFGVPMPSWWSPSHRFAWLGPVDSLHPADRGDRHLYVSSPASRDESVSRYQRITASLETGAEVPA